MKKFTGKSTTFEWLKKVAILCTTLLILMATSGSAFAESEPAGGPELCESTGGSWVENSCGDYYCGQPPLCYAIIPGCDCGAGKNFDASKGCMEDAACPGAGKTEEEYCITTGGIWEPNSCGDYTCGSPPLCEAIIPGCNCGPTKNMTPTGCETDYDCGGTPPECSKDEDCVEGCSGMCSNGSCLYVATDGCTSDDECKDGSYCDECGDCIEKDNPEGGEGSEGGTPATKEEYCVATGGTWAPYACGDYVCGVAKPCEAEIPGCNCGPDKKMTPEGCVKDPECGGTPTTIQEECEEKGMIYAECEPCFIDSCETLGQAIDLDCPQDCVKGCGCPAEAPVYEPGLGCITEEECPAEEGGEEGEESGSDPNAEIKAECEAQGLEFSMFVTSCTPLTCEEALGTKPPSLDQCETEEAAPGCVCPEDTPVSHPDLGCITKEECPGEEEGGAPATAEDFCVDTGGTWDPNACGDYVCGIPNPCEAIIPGCDCGPDMNMTAEGCVEAPECGGTTEEEEVCVETGGTWDPNSCGHYVCGAAPECLAIEPGCNCGPEMIMTPEGCVEDPVCTEEEEESGSEGDDPFDEYAELQAECEAQGLEFSMSVTSCTPLTCEEALADDETRAGFDQCETEFPGEGCVCPEDTPVTHPELGCITVAECSNSEETGGNSEARESDEESGESIIAIDDGESTSANVGDTSNDEGCLSVEGVRPVLGILLLSLLLSPLGFFHRRRENL